MDRNENRYTDRSAAKGTRSGAGGRGGSSGRVTGGAAKAGDGRAGGSGRAAGANSAGGRGGSSGRAVRSGAGGDAGKVRRSGAGTAGRSLGNGSRYVEKRDTAGRQRAAAGKKRKNGRKGRGRRSRIFPVLLVLLLILIAGCGAGAYFLLNGNVSLGEAKSPLPEVSVSLESLDSPYAVLMDQETGTVIGSKNSDEIIYPASMVKIMTVLTAIENIKNLDKTITMAYDFYDELYAQDASRAGFEPGEEAVIRDLLYGALLPSGAECCMQLALEAAGSEAAFVELMNQKAQALGLTKTHFTNATGLHDDDQYSTVTEIGEILRAAVENKTFYQVFTTHSYTVGATSAHPEGFTFWSTMFKNMQSSTVINGEILGGKTGYTDEAGRCLASMAKINGRPYILVTAGWASNPVVEQYHINDAFLGYNALGRAVEQ